MELIDRLIPIGTSLGSIKGGAYRPVDSHSEGPWGLSKVELIDRLIPIQKVPAWSIKGGAYRPVDSHSEGPWGLSKVELIDRLIPIQKVPGGYQRWSSLTG